MLLRLAGAAVVVAGSAALGFYYAAQEAFRVQHLMEFKKALLILSSEIEYMRTPLPAACSNIAKRTGKPVGPLLAHFSELLLQNEGETAYQLWIQALNTHKDHTFLANEDWNVIEGFGKTLGYLDRQMQQNAISYVVEYIDDKATSLQVQSDKNKRMFRSLGIIGGLLLAVVLW